MNNITTSRANTKKVYHLRKTVTSAVRNKKIEDEKK